MSKIDKISEAKKLLAGQYEPEPMRVRIMLERNDAGEVLAFDEGRCYAPVDMVVTLCKDRADSEFWNTFDSQPLVEAARLRLTGQTANDGKVNQFNVTSKECAKSLNRLYNENKTND
jgi:hypothetical protein